MEVKEKSVMCHASYYTDKDVGVFLFYFSHSILFLDQFLLLKIGKSSNSV